MIKLPLRNKYNVVGTNSNNVLRVEARYHLLFDDTCWITLDYNLTINRRQHISCSTDFAKRIREYNKEYNRYIRVTDFIISKPDKDSITISGVRGLTTSDLVIFKMMVF